MNNLVLVDDFMLHIRYLIRNIFPPDVADVQK